MEEKGKNLSWLTFPFSYPLIVWNNFATFDLFMTSSIVHPHLFLLSLSFILIFLSISFVSSHRFSLIDSITDADAAIILSNGVHFNYTHLNRPSQIWFSLLLVRPFHVIVHIIQFKPYPKPLIFDNFIPTTFIFILVFLLELISVCSSNLTLLGLIAEPGIPFIIVLSFPSISVSSQTYTYILFRWYIPTVFSLDWTCVIPLLIQSSSFLPLILVFVPVKTSTSSIFHTHLLSFPSLYPRFNIELEMLSCLVTISHC